MEVPCAEAGKWESWGNLWSPSVDRAHKCQCLSAKVEFGREAGARERHALHAGLGEHTSKPLPFHGIHWA